MKKTLLTCLTIWLPLIVLDRFWGSVGVTSDARVALVEDLSAHARLLLAVPIMMAATGFADARLKLFADQTALRLTKDASSGFEDHLAFVRRILSSKVFKAALVALSLLVTLSFLFSADSSFAPDRHTWIYWSSGRPTPAGWWYGLVSMPAFVFLVLWWATRFALWALSVLKISTLPLVLVPEHPDEMAGLEYLSYLPIAFTPVVTAIACVMSSLIAIDMQVNDSVLSSFGFEIGAYCLLAVFALHLPLMLLAPKLTVSRIDGVTAYGALVRKHHLRFRDKWLGEDAPQEELVGTPDLSSKADADGSYQSLPNMRLIPIRRKALLASFGIVSVPFLPLVFIQYSLADVLSRLATALMG